MMFSLDRITTGEMADIRIRHARRDCTSLRRTAPVGRGSARWRRNAGAADRRISLVRTEHAAEAGSDGIVILPDGIKYVSSVRFGSVSQIHPGQPAKMIAAGIPSAASMGYDPRQKQLIIPMNNNNVLAFIKLTD
jgi:hypothetical protein